MVVRKVWKLEGATTGELCGRLTTQGHSTDLQMRPAWTVAIDGAAHPCPQGYGWTVGGQTGHAAGSQDAAGCRQQWAVASSSLCRPRKLVLELKARPQWDAASHSALLKTSDGKFSYVSGRVGMMAVRGVEEGREHCHCGPLNVRTLPKLNLTETSGNKNPLVLRAFQPLKRQLTRFAA